MQTLRISVLGFSMTAPGLSGQDIAVEESEASVQFFHTPSREKWGGLIGSIEVIAPRCKFFSEGYDSAAYQILAIGEDRVFFWKSPGGGANSGGAQLKSYEILFSDVAGTAYMQAVGYLTGYGVLIG